MHDIVICVVLGSSHLYKESQIDKKVNIQHDGYDLQNKNIFWITYTRHMYIEIPSFYKLL